MEPDLEFPPSINGDIFPKAQWDDIKNLTGCLKDLARYCSDFEAALMLFHTAPTLSATDFSKRRITLSWQFVAARDAVMSVFHFGKCLESIRHTQYLVPAIKSGIDAERQKAATREFNKSFPLAEDLRHAIAHSAEIKGSAKQRAKHAFVGSHMSPNMIIHDARGMTLDIIDGHTFRKNFNGALVSLDMTAISLSRLKYVKSEYWSVYPAEILNGPRPF